MKKDKWLKWKVGAALTLGVTALFQTIRASGEYQAKTAEASATKSDQSGQIQQQQDSVIDEWLGEQQQPAGDGSVRRSAKPAPVQPEILSPGNPGVLSERFRDVRPSSHDTARPRT
jgi:hypothetical protein